MSTKSTIFLTQDNEHCYDDCSDPNYDINKIFLGNTITIEFDKKNINIVCNDEDDLIIEIKPNCELYDIINSIRK